MRILGMFGLAFALVLSAVILPSRQDNASAIAAENTQLEMLRQSTTLPLQKLTCQGVPATPDAKVYQFGFKTAAGDCSTMEVFANSPTEARMCAQRQCVNCTSLEDITGRYKTEEGVQPFGGMTNKYCPVK